MSYIERETSICINRCVDLGKTALYIAAEDDSLISHSSVPLPVDAFLERLDHLSTDYCPHYSSSLGSSPETLLDSIEKYLYNIKVYFHVNSVCWMSQIIEKSFLGFNSSLVSINVLPDSIYISNWRGLIGKMRGIVAYWKWGKSRWYWQLDLLYLLATAQH